MRNITEAQRQKSQDRKNTFRTMAGTIAKMTDQERDALIAKVVGIVTIEGHVISRANMAIIALQNPKATIIGGFRQWLNAGRCVRKGEHGLMIWCPTTKKSDIAGEDSKTFFIPGTVFDVSQTEPIDNQPEDQKPSEENSAEPASTETTAPRQADYRRQAEAYRKIADNMQNSIDAGLRDRLDNTPRRRCQASRARHEAWNQQRAQKGLYALADALQAGTCPDILKDKITKNDAIAYTGHSLSRNCGYYDYIETSEYTDMSEIAVAFRKLADAEPTPEQKRDRDIQNKTTELAKYSFPGFFPTPATVVKEMLDRAGIMAGMRVLEPSAGTGNLAEAARAAGAEVDCIEVVGKLSELLQLKGFNTYEDDFLAKSPNGVRYDVVLMNPPFEHLQDIDHVKHAHQFLKDGGRIVSVMSQGPFFRQDRKSQEFRQWFDDNGGEAVDLPDGSFKASGTGVSAKLVVIGK